LVQCDPNLYNESQKLKQEEYATVHGKNAWDNIRWSDKHHPLKAHKSKNYSLNEAELELLLKNKMLFKSDPVHTENKYMDKYEDAYELKQNGSTFAQIYLDLYNNDLPVFITSDSMLFALHKFYLDYLSNLEAQVLFPKLVILCKSLLDTLYEITPTPENISYLSKVEALFMVPYVIMQVDRNLIDNELPLSLPYTKEEIVIMLEENKPYFDKMCNVDEGKLKKFLEYMDWDKSDDKYGHNPYMWKVVQNKKICEMIEIYIPPANTGTNNEPIEFKYADRKLFDHVLQCVATNTDIEFTLGQTNISISGSVFKTRAHYGKSVQLKRYAWAIQWFTHLNFVIDSDSELFAIAGIIAKIGYANLDKVNDFQNIISKLIGTSTNLTVTSFMHIIFLHLPKFTDLNMTVNVLIDNKDFLLSNINNKATFSIIGCGSHIDNTILSELVDMKLIDDDGNSIDRKFPSILDLVYTAFGNKSVLENIANKEMTNYSYEKHLGKLRTDMDNYTYDNTIYTQELKMLRALSVDNFPNINSDLWHKKQAITQIAHYAELKHDNCLYVNEYLGAQSYCEHPDLLIEPVPVFWKEMLKLVTMMLEISEPNLKSPDVILLTRFADIISKFITYLDLYMANKPISDTLMTELKSVIVEHKTSGGDLYYSGWYIGLFREEDDALVYKPEIASYFTGVDDMRGLGGICHIGTGSCRLLYVVVTDPLTMEEKIMIGPVYTAYEFVSEVRLGDDDWAMNIENHSPISL
jgi:hypothetical protein